VEFWIKEGTGREEVFEVIRGSGCVRAKRRKSERKEKCHQRLFIYINFVFPEILVMYWSEMCG